MNTFLQITAQRRRAAFQQVDESIGLQALSVEKDFWVCWTLRELFALPGLGGHLTFKGGTSLSKAWKLIARFSEDPSCKVFLMSLQAGGVALNLTAASATFLMDSWWNPAREAQVRGGWVVVGAARFAFYYFFF